jgi:hypothetical protein
VNALGRPKLRGMGSATVRRVPPLGASIDFLEAPLAVFGLLLVRGALIAGLARRSFLSLTAAFVIAGFLLGDGGLELLDLDPRSQFVQALAVIALTSSCFATGSRSRRRCSSGRGTSLSAT